MITIKKAALEIVLSKVKSLVAQEPTRESPTGHCVYLAASQGTLTATVFNNGAWVSDFADCGTGEVTGLIRYQTLLDWLDLRSDGSDLPLWNNEGYLCFSHYSGHSEHPDKYPDRYEFEGVKYAQESQLAIASFPQTDLYENLKAPVGEPLFSVELPYQKLREAYRELTKFLTDDPRDVLSCLLFDGQWLYSCDGERVAAKKLLDQSVECQPIVLPVALLRVVYDREEAPVTLTEYEHVLCMQIGEDRVYAAKHPDAYPVLPKPDLDKNVVPVPRSDLVKLVEASIGKGRNPKTEIWIALDPKGIWVEGERGSGLLETGVSAPTHDDAALVDGRWLLESLKSFTCKTVAIAFDRLGTFTLTIHPVSNKGVVDLETYHAVFGLKLKDSLQYEYSDGVLTVNRSQCLNPDRRYGEAIERMEPAIALPYAWVDAGLVVTSEFDAGVEYGYNQAGVFVRIENRFVPAVAIAVGVESRELVEV